MKGNKLLTNSLIAGSSIEQIMAKYKLSKSNDETQRWSVLIKFGAHAVMKPQAIVKSEFRIVRQETR